MAAGGAGDFEEGAGVVQIGGEGFLDEDVLAGAEGGGGEACVLGHRGEDEGRRRAGVVEEFGFVGGEGQGTEGEGAVALGGASAGERDFGEASGNEAGGLGKVGVEDVPHPMTPRRTRQHDGAASGAWGSRPGIRGWA